MNRSRISRKAAKKIAGIVRRFRRFTQIGIQRNNDVYMVMIASYWSRGKGLCTGIKRCVGVNLRNLRPRFFPFGIGILVTRDSGTQLVKLPTRPGYG